jgi:hypothetical protein
LLWNFILNYRVYSLAKLGAGPQVHRSRKWRRLVTHCGLQECRLHTEGKHFT